MKHGDGTQKGVGATSSPTPDGAGPLGRLGSSNRSRWLLSALFVVNFAALVMWNAPNSPLKAAVMPVVRPYLNAVGLSQNWAVFAPDPPKQTFEIFANISYEDGSSARWSPPQGDALVGHYRTYRWRKWAGYAHLEANTWMWEPTARWVAQHHDHAGRRPVQVELVRRWQDLTAPGSGQPDSEWHHYAYYTLDLTRGMRR